MKSVRSSERSYPFTFILRNHRPPRIESFCSDLPIAERLKFALSEMLVKCVRNGLEYIQFGSLHTPGPYATRNLSAYFPFLVNECHHCTTFEGISHRVKGIPSRFRKSAENRCKTYPFHTCRKRVNLLRMDKISPNFPGISHSQILDDAHSVVNIHTRALPRSRPG